VATAFEKRHADVLRAIRDVVTSLPVEARRKFAPFKINDLTGESTSHYEMDRDGFTLLAMGFTGEKALAWKLKYVDAFNRQSCAPRLWEIAENLHRADLSAMERAEQIAEYARLAKEKRESEKPAQLAPVSGGRGNRGGDRQAARDLGLTRDEVRRAERVAAIAPEAKEAARKAGLGDNQSALLRTLQRVPTSTSIQIVARSCPPAPAPPDAPRHVPVRGASSYPGAIEPGADRRRHRKAEGDL
jgi:ParB family chromosome partitioning protein